MAVGLRVLTCNNSLAPNDRVAAGFDSQRERAGRNLAATTTTKKMALACQRRLSPRSLLFCEELPFPYA